MLLPGKFHGQRTLMGYRLWGHKESNSLATKTAKARGSGSGETKTEIAYL